MAVVTACAIDDADVDEMRRCALLLSLFAASVFADVTLDPKFGTGGIVRLPLPLSWARVARARSGDFYALTVELRTGDNPLQVLMIRHLTPNGQFDPAFGSGGVVTETAPPVPYATEAVGYQIDVQADGKIIAAMTTPVNGLWRVRFFRYLPSGARDVTFGDGGTVLTDDRFRMIESFVAAPNGQILASAPQVVRRWNSDGTPDANFGIAGEAAIPGKNVVTLAVTSDNGVLIGGSMQAAEGLYSYVGRCLANGQLDPSFNASSATPGFRFFPYVGYDGLMWADVFIQPDGRYVYSLWATPIGRLTTAGERDSTFTPAWRFKDLKNVSVVGLGSIFITAKRSSGTVLLGHLNADGSPDDYFGNLGFITVGPPSAELPVGNDVRIGWAEQRGDTLYVNGWTGDTQFLAALHVVPATLTNIPALHPRTLLLLMTTIAIAALLALTRSAPQP